MLLIWPLGLAKNDLGKKFRLKYFREAHMHTESLRL